MSGARLDGNGRVPVDDLSWICGHGHLQLVYMTIWCINQEKDVWLCHARVSDISQVRSNASNPVIAGSVDG